MPETVIPGGTKSAVRPAALSGTSTTIDGLIRSMRESASMVVKARGPRDDPSSVQMIGTVESPGRCPAGTRTRKVRVCPRTSEWTSIVCPLIAEVGSSYVLRTNAVPAAAPAIPAMKAEPVTAKTPRSPNLMTFLAFMARKLEREGSVS
jgi:hypothetical protein